MQRTRVYKNDQGLFKKQLMRVTKALAVTVHFVEVKNRS